MPTPNSQEEVIKLHLAEAVAHEVGHALASLKVGCSWATINLFRSSELRGQRVVDAERERMFLGSNTHPDPGNDMDRAVIAYAGILAEYQHTEKLMGLSDEQIFQLTERADAMSGTDRHLVEAAGEGRKKEAFEKTLEFVRTYQKNIDQYTKLVTSAFLLEGGLNSTFPITQLDLPDEY